VNGFSANCRRLGSGNLSIAVLGSVYLHPRHAFHGSDQQLHNPRDAEARVSDFDEDRGAVDTETITLITVQSAEFNRHRRGRGAMAGLFTWLWDWLLRMFWTMEMDVAIIGLQNAGKTSLVRVLAVRTRFGPGRHRSRVAD